MKEAASILIAIALPLAAFSWWGLFSAGGQHRFDEMDGMTPFFAGGVALIAFASAAILLLLARKRRDRV